jgi:hypothetical protein
MQKHIVFSILLWSNLAVGFAEDTSQPIASRSILGDILRSHLDLSENMIGATIIIILCVLHVFYGKKSNIKSKVPVREDLPKTATQNSPQIKKNRPTVAIVDDDIFIRESWELFLREFNLITFDSPESFLLALDRNTSLINTLDAIVVDYDFGNKSDMSGTDLAVILRKKTCSPIILSTDCEQKDIQGFDRFDLHLDKKILDWHGLEKLLPAVISQ